MIEARVGVIGVGNMGKNHARVYSEISQLLAVSDLDTNLGLEVAREFGVAFYLDYNEMLQKEHLDAVSVVVPTNRHREVIFDTIGAKIPTLVEKPVSDNLVDAQAMLAFAQNKRVLLMVGHIERFNPAVVELKKLIDEGKLGKVVNLLAIRVGISPPNPYAKDVALDLGIHDIDVFNYLLGRFPNQKVVPKTKLYSQSEADSACLLLQYGDITGMIHTNWITPAKMRKLFVYGFEGYVELDYIEQRLILYDRVINSELEGSYNDLISLSENPKREIRSFRKEPLKEELVWFLSNRDNWHVSNMIASIEALKTVI